MARFNSKDPVVNRLRLAYIRARAQARYLGQDWQVSWEYYLYLWLRDNNWQRKGRGSHSLQFVRIDKQQAWTDNNTQLMIRRTHGQ